MTYRELGVVRTLPGSLEIGDYAFAVLLCEDCGALVKAELQGAHDRHHAETREAPR